MKDFYEKQATLARVGLNEDFSDDDGDNSVDVESTDPSSPMKEIEKFVVNNEIHKIREKGSTKAMQLLAEICFPPLVGKQRWKVRHQHCALSSLLTEADEALAYLIIENNFVEWKMKVKGLEIEDDNRQTKYTHGGLDAKTTKKGWSLDGRKRYNKFFDEIYNARSSSWCKTLEDGLMDLWKQGSNGGKRKRNESDENGQSTDTAQRRLELEEERFIPRICKF